MRAESSRPDKLSNDHDMRGWNLRSQPTNRVVEPSVSAMQLDVDVSGPAGAVFMQEPITRMHGWIVGNDPPYRIV